MTVKFTVDGRPKPKERPRMNRKTGTVYTPSATRAYEKQVAWAYKAARGTLFSGAIALKVTAYFAPRAANEKQATQMLSVSGLHHTDRPDIDNIVKAISDGLNGVAYRDDKQIYRVDCEKLYGLPERVEIEVEETF